MAITEPCRQFFDRQMLQQVFTKHTGPAHLQQPASLHAQMLPRIKQFTALVIS